MRNQPRSPKRSAKKPIPFRMRVPIILVRVSSTTFMVAIVGLIAFSYQQLFDSDHFIIKNTRFEVADKSDAGGHYARLLEMGRGRNIILFDTKAATAKVMEEHPEFSNFQVIKTFPDTLILRAKLRVPVAQVGEKEFYLVDDHGITLSGMTKIIQEGLPVITGAEWRSANTIGYVEKSARMAKGLELLAVMKETGFLDEHTVTKIDISDPKNMMFVIEDGLEIKIGNSDFDERLYQLDKTLGSIVVDKNNITYIDLRFAEVVLGTR